MASGTASDFDGVHNHVYENPDDVIAKAIQDDPQLNDIIERLGSDVNIDPDHDIRIGDDDDHNDVTNADSDSVSTSSSLKDNDARQNGGHASSDSGSPEHHDKASIASSSSATSSTGRPSHNSSGTPHRDSSSRGSVMSKSSSTTSGDGKKSSSGVKSRSSIKNPLHALKKLTKFHKEEPKKRPKSFRSEFTAVMVDRLPQVFVVKYMGHREVTGMFGLHHVRRPVDEMVKEVKKSMDAQAQVELPLLYVVVSPKGLDLREHKNNKVKNAFPAGLIPIDFISYGVQDIKYWRVFTCIVVRELSSRTRTATCHAFLCDSSHSGRKMALSLGAAFNVYSKKLRNDGKVHNFQVELRPPDELASAVDAECEA